MNIQRPGIAERLQRFLRLTGRIKLKLEPFVISTIQVGDLSEADTPPIIRHCVASGTEPGVAAERFTWRFESPPSVLCVIRRINFTPRTTQLGFIMAFSSVIAVPTSGTTNVSKSFTDGRLLVQQGLPQPAGVITTGTQAAALAVATWRTRWELDLMLPYKPPAGWVIGSGDENADGRFGFFEGVGTSTNNTVEWFCEWDEYQLV